MFAIEVHNLSKSYYGIPVLRGLNFSVSPGDSFGFAGANGAGKSTLLKCLLDFCHYQSGDLRLFDRSCKNRRARARLAFLPERFIPPYYLTGEHFLQFMMKLQGETYIAERVRQMLAALDLDVAALKKPVRSFSKGMTQKLGLASCFLAKRDIYILDEPMSGLDPKARALVKQQFQKLIARGATLFFTSQMLADIDEICSRIGVLHQGRICYLGAPADMREKFGDGTLEEAYLRAIGDHA